MAGTRNRSRDLDARRCGPPRRVVSAAIAGVTAAFLGLASADVPLGASAGSESRPPQVEGPHESSRGPVEEAREWYLGGHAGGPTTTSTLYLLNAGSRAAQVELLAFTPSADPQARALLVAPASLAEIGLDQLVRTPNDEPFWIRVRSTETVLPQIVQLARARRDAAIETLEVSPPIAGPLDESHREWIYPDGFQGGPAPWQERELLTLLNPGSREGVARLTVRFRDGRPALETAIAVAAGRVANVDLWSCFDAIAGVESAVQGDYALTLSAEVPLLSSQIRRARRRGDDEVVGSRPSLPIRNAEALRADAWYYAGGWIVPRDEVRRGEDTWQLLFTYGARDEPARVDVTPLGSAGPVESPALVAPAGRSDLQWLHLDPWRGVLGTNGPWGLVLRGAGPVAPSVTVAEYEEDAEGLPGAMDGAPLTPGPLADAWWLGVARHGVVPPHEQWAAAWQLLNPGPSPIRVALHVFTEGAAPAVHHVDVAGHSVARVTGDEVVGRRDARPFAVVATGSGPFLAHAWQRATRPGRGETRALASEPGVRVARAAVAGADPR